jgi:beta-phosphoglucomutase-like phosphatase (HAD superfamily)
MIDVVLFELEAVVFDTLELRDACVREARAQFPDAGAGGDAVVADLIAAASDRAFSRAIVARGSLLCPGAREFIEGGEATGRLGAVTRMRRVDAQVLLDLAGFTDALAVVICADDVIDGKPSPEGYREALARLAGTARGVAIDRTIALENGPTGILAARAAGIRCVAVGAVEPHVAMEADAYAPSLAGQTLQSIEALVRPGRESLQ